VGTLVANGRPEESIVESDRRHHNTRMNVMSHRETGWKKTHAKKYMYSIYIYIYILYIHAASSEIITLRREVCVRACVGVCGCGCVWVCVGVRVGVCVCVCVCV